MGLSLCRGVHVQLCVCVRVCVYYSVHFHVFLNLDSQM